MIESPYRIRPATAADADRLRQTMKYTLANPEGRAVRKSHKDAAQRNELVILEHYNSKERVWDIAAFVEWHTRIDGGMTIRDAGSEGETPAAGIIKRLLRELLRLQAPTSASVKVRVDQPVWTSVFEELPGFVPEGKEFSRPYWRTIWTWTREAERARTAIERRPPAPPGRPATFRDRGNPPGPRTSR